MLSPARGRQDVRATGKLPAFCDQQRKVVEVTGGRSCLYWQESLMNLSTTRVLIALAALAALFSIVTIKAISTNASAATSLAQASDDARRITPDEVRDLLKRNKAVLVDVRGVEAYKAGHIKSALSIP